MHEELQAIRTLEAAAEKNVSDAAQNLNSAVRKFNSIKAKRAQLEAAAGDQGEQEPEHHRGRIIRGPWVAAGAALVGTGARWLYGNTRTVAAFGTGAAVTTAAAIAIAPPSNGQSSPNTQTGAIPAQPPTAPALPLPSHNPAPADPHKTQPHAQPSGVSPRKAPPITTLTPTSILHSPAVGLPGTLRTRQLRPRLMRRRPSSDAPACRIYLTPLIHRGLICGRIGE